MIFKKSYKKYKNIKNIIMKLRSAMFSHEPGMITAAGRKLCESIWNYMNYMNLYKSIFQVDAIVKTAIELLASCQDINPMTYRSMASNFLGFLVVVPDSPEKPPLYMFNGFLNAVVRFFSKLLIAKYRFFLKNWL